MGKIVDENGKTFTPSIEEQILSSLAKEVKLTLVESSKPSALLEIMRIEQLRRSCGVPEEGTITFKRFLPYSISKVED